MHRCCKAASMLSVYKTANEALPDYESTQFSLSPTKGRKRQVQFLSCTTITVYENLSKNSFFWRTKVLRPATSGVPFVCECKGTAIFPFHQNISKLFSKKNSKLI